MKLEGGEGEKEKERTDSVLDPQSIELSLSESAPNLRLVDLVGILRSSIQTGDVLDENSDGLGVLVVLVVHCEGLLVESLLDSDPGDLVRIVVLELADVSDDFPLVGSNGGEEEEVLESSVVRERRRLEDDLLQELDQLGRKIVVDEGLDGDRDVVGIGGFGDSGGDDLVDELTSVDVVGDEDLSPKFRKTTLDEVSRLVLEHRVRVGDGDELVVAESFGEGDEREVGISLLAVLSHDEGLVELEEGGKEGRRGRVSFRSSTDCLLFLLVDSRCSPSRKPQGSGSNPRRSWRGCCRERGPVDQRRLATRPKAR